MPATKEFTTDVLVIGGGIAGLCAANKAVDQGVSVLITDKSHSAWGGQMPLSGGAFRCYRPKDVEAHVKFFVEEGEYLNDQELLYSYSKDSFPTIQEMFEWGVPFQTDMQGKLKVRRGYGAARIPRVEMALPTLLGRALEKGAQVLNKVYTVDLLTYDGRVVGAVGFHVRTGDFYVVQAKATILACGGCNYKARRLWHTNCGEGVAMAYNAGAELRNAEFGNTYMIANKFTFNDGRGASRGVDYFENARGEPLVKIYPELKNVPPGMHPLIFKRWIHAFYKEIAAGRGPIYLNLTRRPEVAVGFGDDVLPGSLVHGYVNMMKRSGINVTKEKVEWMPVPEYHAGPIRVNLNCATTVPGLYATGDACQNGSAYAGAYEGCGLPGPLGFCVVTGFWAGIAAGKAAATTPSPKIRTTDVSRFKRTILAPLGDKDGYSPYDAIQAIQEIVFKLKNSFIKHKDRLEKALVLVEKVKAKLPNLTAKDSHELVRCHEAKSMALNAEFLFRASLMRTETRGSNIREDYPDRDDANWLKWIIIKKTNGAMTLRTEPVPIEKYKHKPK